MRRSRLDLKLFEFSTSHQISLHVRSPGPWRAAGAGTSPFPSFAPQALNQPILPGWLFANSINVTEENSSSPETEREIVAAHSYGQQLGRIMDVLDELIRKQPAGSLGARPVREFAELRNDIETIKARQAAKRAEQMITDLRTPDIVRAAERSGRR